FDKPTVIIKDDKTDYSFDTAIIEHVTYPRDLRFSKMVSFQALFTDKVCATHKASTDKNYSAFLKNFGQFHVAKLSEAATSTDKLLIEMVSDIQSDLIVLKRRSGERDFDRSRSERTAEGISRIVTVLEDYKKENPKADLLTLLDEQEFRELMIERCDARRY